MGETIASAAALFAYGCGGFFCAWLVRLFFARRFLLGEGTAHGSGV
jgi:hypothetical protein